MKKISLTITGLIVLHLLVFSQIADTAKAKPEFRPSGKLWGYAFGDFAWKQHANTVKGTASPYGLWPKDYNTFEFRRIYLGYDYDISQRFSSQIILSYEGNTLGDGNRSVFIKAANIRWKNIFKNSDLVFGQMSTPIYSTTSEPVWGYRSLEKTIMDMRGIGASADLGLSLQGKFNDKGDYGYMLMIGNGTGSKLENNKYKKLYADLFAKFFNQKLMIDAGADNEIIQASPYKRGKTTLKAFAAYQTKPVTIGAEIFQQVQQNGSIHATLAADSLNDVIASGVSFFLRGPLIADKLNYVLRYDYFNPDNKYKSENTYKSYNGYFTESFILASLDYTPVKNVHIMPNVWYNRYKNRAQRLNNLERNSYDLTGRLTVYYVFR